MQFTKASASDFMARARAIDPLLFDRLISQSNVGSTCDCWDWLASTTVDGYGQIRHHGAKVRTHRAMFSLAFPGVSNPVVRHKCNNPSCINPAHLRAGTPLDNALDRVAAGRGGDLRGAKNGRSVLTDDEARIIRASTEPGSALAKRFGISKAMACRIKRGAAWSHI